MEQIEVELRGSINPWNWSPRMFSISAPHGVVAISRKGHPEAWAHHCLHVTAVQLWPHYKKKHIHKHFDSMEAKLTLRIYGTEVRLVEAVAGASAVPQQQRPVRFTQRGFHPYGHAWMVRFFSYECLERAVNVLKTIQVHEFVENAEIGVNPTDHITTNDSSNNNNSVNINNHFGDHVMDHLSEHEDAGAVEKHVSAAEAAVGEVVGSPAGVDVTAAQGGFATPPAAQFAAENTPENPPLVVDAVRRGLPPSSVMEGNVASDLDAIHAAWEHMRSRPHSFEQIQD